MDEIGAYQVCAVDGGGTGCRVAIANPNGVVLARASGGPANYASNAAQAVENVVGAVRLAAGKMGTDMHRLVAHVGLAGIMNDTDACALVAQLPFKHCTVTDDRVTSTIGALDNRDGALLAVGTGTFVALRRGGEFRFFGGWGQQVGDQASGAWLGRELLVHALLAVDGLEAESDLTRTVLARFDGTPADIVAFARQAPPADYASFAPLIVEAAKAGDLVARQLMDRGTAYLNTALGAAGLSGDDIVCLVGGVGPHYGPYLAPQYHSLIRLPKGTALDGALQLARQNQEALETPK
jgi:glucosamine kinase